MFAQFPFALRRFLRHRLTLEEARQIVHERMERREENFLRFVERSVYSFPRSPYLPLLKRAGCELGDLRAIVKQKGLEGALRALRAHGVYVTYEEFKGRKPIVRNGTTVPVKASDFDNPFARRDFPSQTGGSTGLATSVGLGLDYFAARAPYQMLFLSAYGVMSEPTAYWMGILPGSGLQFILQRTDLREPIHRWFSFIGWRDSKYWLKYDLATLYIVFWLRVFGARVPMPEVVKFRRDVVIQSGLLIRPTYETVAADKYWVFGLALKGCLRLVPSCHCTKRMYPTSTSVQWGPRRTRHVIDGGLVLCSYIKDFASSRREVCYAVAMVFLWVSLRLIGLCTQNWRWLSEHGRRALLKFLEGALFTAFNKKRKLS